MRILHTADWHLGKNLEGYSRMDEQEKFLEDFVKIVQEQEIDLIIVAGDVYDTSNPPARAENMFYNTLKKLSNNGERMTLIISGNHDNPDRLVAARSLASEHGIVMVATPKSIVETGYYGKNKIVNSGEGFIEVEINGERSVIVTIPYPSEKRLNEILYSNMADDEENLMSYSNRIKELFHDLSKNYREDTINLAVSHLFASGAEETGSERSIQLGGSFIVDSSCFPEKAQYIALGHIHKPMTVPGTNKKAKYAGSPLHYNKKEITFDKGCYIIDVKAGEEASISEIKFKVYKPIEVWKCVSIEDALNKCTDNSIKDCWVYLEITTDRYITEEEVKKMKSIKKDILEIVPKITLIIEEEELMGNLMDKSFKDIFTEFYVKVRGVEPVTEVLELLLSIVEEEEKENETN